MEFSDKFDIEQVVRQHHADVYRYAFRLSGTATDAEDLTQEAFLIALEHGDQVRDPKRVKSWLFTVLRRCYLKDVQRRRPQPVTDFEMEIDSIADVAVDESVDVEALQAALAQLPPEYRLVVLMYYFEDCSYREIAAQLEVPIGTVMSRLSRAKSSLRKLLNSKTMVAGGGSAAVSTRH